MNLAGETAFSCRGPRNHAWGEDLAGAQRCLVLSIPTSRARARAAGPRLPAFLEAQLLDGFIGDGYRNAYAAFLFDGRMAVNGAFGFDGHMAVNGAFVFDGHMAVNDTFILMRKGEPTLFWDFIIAPIKNGRLRASISCAMQNAR